MQWVWQCDVSYKFCSGTRVRKTLGVSICWLKSVCIRKVLRPTISTASLSLSFSPPPHVMGHKWKVVTARANACLSNSVPQNIEKVWNKCVPVLKYREHFCPEIGKLE